MEAATATAGRTLVETTNPGWFIDANDPDGKRQRKAAGDTIISRDEYEARKTGERLGTDTTLAQETARQRQAGKEHSMADDAEKDKAEKDAAKAAAKAEKDAAKAAAKKPPKVTQSTTGKTLVGETTEIKCAWVPEDKRNKAQARLFDKFAKGDKKALTYEKVLAAADQGDDKGGKPDGRKRVIKVQDAFQVRFHPDNAGAWRNELRRRANAAKPKKAKADKPAEAKAEAPAAA